MNFYVIKEENIKLTNELTQKDIIFVLDGRVGYIWKGEEAIDLDEFTAKKVEQQIKKKFLDVSFELIPDITIAETDNPKIVEIKTEIKNRLPKPSVVKIQKTKENLFNKIKSRFGEFRTYENSWNWRKKLSNLTNLWKLSVFNIVILIFSITLMYNFTIFHLTYGDFFLLIALLSLTAILIANLLFVIFPMKFPIEPLSIGAQMETINAKAQEEEVKDESLKMPPKPIEPELPAVKKGSKKSQKELVKQIEIGPLKASTAGTKKAEKKGEEGVEYSTKEDMELDIPAIPEAPKITAKITVNSPGLSTDLLEKIKKMESTDVKVVLVNCERCKGVIPIPINKKILLKSELPVIPLSYVHKNLQNKDPHCITLHIDHDFDIRRQYTSEVTTS